MRFNRWHSAVLLVGLLAVAPAAMARYTLSCESRDYRYQHCSASTQGYARLVSQRSSAACVQGRTWGYDRGGVWVNKGCSGVFEGRRQRRVAASAGPGPLPGVAVPRWAIGTFGGNDATGTPQVVEITGSGIVTIRFGGGRYERGRAYGDRIEMGNRAMRITQVRSGGIAIDGMVFRRR